MKNQKPIVLVDQDGPLADFDAAIWKAVTEAGIGLSCTQETQTVRFLSDAVSEPDGHERMQRIVEGKGWFRNLPAVPGCREGMDALAEIAEVWICTKPLETNRTCRDEKADWVEEHLGSKWVDRLIIAPDKSVVRGFILLDDAPKPKWFPRAEWTPVVYPTVWNGSGSQWDGLARWEWGQDSGDLLRKNRVYAAGKAMAAVSQMYPLLRG